MPLIPYHPPVPCYQTDDITRYSPELLLEASSLFELVRGRIHSSVVDRHCKIYDGSFSIVATTSQETAAKIVIYERRVGRWLLGNNPSWTDGVYVWVRANDDSGRALEKAIQDPRFDHRWVLDRLVPNRAVSVAPNPAEHFYFFVLEPADDRGRLADLLAFCSTL